MEKFYFNGDINSDSVGALIDFMESIEDNEVIVYFNTPGGFQGDMEVLIDYINNSDKIITFKCSGSVASCGFTTLCKINCNIKILDGCTGMFHKLRNLDLKKNKPVKIKKGLNKFIDEKIKKINTNEVLNSTAEENKQWLKLYQCIGINEELLKRFENGEDVHLSTGKMRELFERS